MTAASTRHDIVALGASAGGVDALTQVLKGLPAELPAAVFVVMHTSPFHPSKLPDLLGRATRLPVAFAIHGEPVVPGRVYVAPPDNQMMLRDGSLHVVRGPKENGHRPAVDALFRTAASAYGPRVIGVVLTGHQNCGTAGLLSIKARGGLAVVQHPGEAEAPEMPQSAIAHVAVDHVASLAELPRLLARLVEQAPGPSKVPSGLMRQLEGGDAGVAADRVCPLCQGALTGSEVNGSPAFRSHAGHSFSRQDLEVEQSDSQERALWAASRALEESAALSRRLADASTGQLKAGHEEKAATEVRNAEVIREIILGGKL